MLALLYRRRRPHTTSLARLALLFVYTAELKDQLQTKLDNARVPSAGDDTETSLINEAIRWIPLRVIERIKEFGTKLRVHLLSYPRILHQCDIKVVDAWPNDGCTPGRAEADRRLALEAFRLEETIQRLFVARQLWVAN